MTKRTLIQLGVCMAVLAVSAAAQTNTFPASGAVGIGTTSPTLAPLQTTGSPGTTTAVFGSSSTGIALTAGYPTVGFNSYYNGGFYSLATGFGGDIELSQGDGAMDFLTAPSVTGANASQTQTERMRITSTGNVGIGTASPGETLDVNGNITFHANAQYLFGDTSGNTSTRMLGINAANDFYFGSVDASINTIHVQNNGSDLLTILKSGYVGIGTTNPAATLEVNGIAQVDQIIHANGGILFPGSSTAQTTPWTGVLCGGDYAEDVEGAGDKKQYEPGDVLVLTDGDNDEVQKSSEPYSEMVAGIFATKPGIIGQRQSLSKSTDALPMAMVGIVPTKVTAENGPIRKGDLLVTSSRIGYAMKGTDRSRMLGAVIGKAMGSLDTGTGMIEVLVTLQ